MREKPGCSREYYFHESVIAPYEWTLSCALEGGSYFERLRCCTRLLNAHAHAHAHAHEASEMQCSSTVLLHITRHLHPHR